MRHSPQVVAPRHTRKEARGKRMPGENGHDRRGRGRLDWRRLHEMRSCEHASQPPPRPPPRRPQECRSRSTMSRRRVADSTGAIVETDCDWSRTLSEILGCKVWLKFENQQFTASFKERGALNRLSALSPAERKRGVIAMSAGNHAQGVAYHAHRLGIPATIVMPVQHADGEGGQHPPARRRGDPDGRDGGGGRRLRRSARARAWAHLHPPLR